MKAQNINVENFQKDFQIHIAHTNSPVKIDGILDDSIWNIAEKKTDFFVKFPTDDVCPNNRTEVQVAYDDKFLYVAFTSYDSGKNIIQSLKRDIGHLDNDGVAIILDPQNSHTNGFIFAVNALNAQSEDQVSMSQDNPLSWSWNNKWFSETKRYNDRWTAEMAIPFKTLRFPPDKKLWGINFLRVDMKYNQYSGWTHVPTNFNIYNMGYTGSLLWDKAPPAPGKNVVLIPYASGNMEGDQENNNPTKASLSGGLDSKITLTSSLNLDLTLNPDFSQVEVDQQVTNLTRYDIFLPEKRSFFLENADIFGEYGIPGLITPFYSRRIGLDTTGNPIPIIGGVRLSGSLDPKTRIGIMSMQTGPKGDYSPENYTAISFNKNVLSRSIFKMYFLDHENFQSDIDKKNNPLNAWGRNAGSTFDYFSRDGKWNWWYAFHYSFKPGISDQNNFQETGFAYNKKKISTILDIATLGTNYYTDMGYVQRINNYDALRDTTIRVGFKHIYGNVTFRIYPKKDNAIVRHTIKIENYLVVNPNYSFNENDFDVAYMIEYKNTAFFRTQIIHNELDLLYPISFTSSTPLPAQHYKYSQASVSYGSDTRKDFSYGITYSGGQFYNGDISSLSGSITLRSRPHLNLIFQAEFDKLNFPDPYGSTELFLLSPKIEYNFSTTVSWTTFLQYNTQANNFNINSRFQYRFKPMSDLYLVYTDNYYTTPLLQNKNRAIVFKVNYWLNL
ncbi:MAG: carbohydrate binding family 9 domain-containing protein [Bacteroidota bacterium]|nr:carbohydrate binding family 9 domain-containing protein [Bacteroidota bacterium]